MEIHEHEVKKKKTNCTHLHLFSVRLFIFKANVRYYALFGEFSYFETDQFIPYLCDSFLVNVL